MCQWVSAAIATTFWPLRLRTACLEGSQHIIGQVQIKVRGDKADGEVYFYVWNRIHGEGEPKDLSVAGRYIDLYTCKTWRMANGDWRISKGREIINWARTDSAADGFFADNPMVPRGKRRGEDFSQTRNWPKRGERLTDDQ